MSNNKGKIEGSHWSLHERYVAVPRHLGDKWRLGLGTQPFHPAQGLDEYLCHLSSAQITFGGQDESANLGGVQCVGFNGTVPNACVFGEDNPTAPANFHKPGCIRRVLREMIVVNRCLLVYLA